MSGSRNIREDDAFARVVEQFRSLGCSQDGCPSEAVPKVGAVFSQQLIKDELPSGVTVHDAYMTAMTMPSDGIFAS